MSGAPVLLRARWVFPVDQPPIEGGTVEIIDGRIARLGSGPDAGAVDLGDVAIIPGLVNSHTHLEFSHLAKPLTPSVPFEKWIHSVVRSRRERLQPLDEIIGRGLAESAQEGTTLLGEIATSDVSEACPDETTPRTVVFWEVLGLDEAAIDRQQAAVERHLAAANGPDEPHVLRGLSPHAPYSIHPDLFHWTIDRAQESGVPVAMHLAETPAELELLDRGTGPIAKMLRDFGIWQDGLFSGGDSVMDFLEPLAALDRVLVVHGNSLNADEIGFLASNPQFSLVFCPRTHAYFRHQEHPWRRLLERNVNVALGTDSRASNPDLSLWRELSFLRESAPEVSDETLLRLATINGAKALGLDGQAGTLAPGKAADLAVVAFGDAGEIQRETSPHHRLLHPQSRVIATLRAGRWQHGPWRR